MLQVLLRLYANDRSTRRTRWRWWGRVRHERGRIHWERLEGADAAVAIMPPLSEFFSDVKDATESKGQVRIRRIVALFRRYGPPTAPPPTGGRLPGIPAPQDTSVSLTEVEWLLNYIAEAGVLASVTSKGELIPLSLWRDMGVTANGGADSDDVTAPPRSRRAQGQVLSRVLTFFARAAKCAAVIVHDHETDMPAPYYAPSPDAPLLGTAAMAILNAGLNPPNGVPCPNHRRCGGYVMQKKRVGRPAIYCASCSPRGSTNSTERSRAFRQRQKLNR